MKTCQEPILSSHTRRARMSQMAVWANHSVKKYPQIILLSCSLNSFSSERWKFCYLCESKENGVLDLGYTSGYCDAACDLRGLWNLNPGAPRPVPADISVTPSWALIQWPETSNSSTAFSRVTWEFLDSRQCPLRNSQRHSGFIQHVLMVMLISCYLPFQVPALPDFLPTLLLAVPHLSPHSLKSEE